MEQHKKGGFKIRNMMHRKTEDSCRMFMFMNVNGKSTSTSVCTYYKQ